MSQTDINSVSEYNVFGSVKNQMTESEVGNIIQQMIQVNTKQVCAAISSHKSPNPELSPEGQKVGISTLSTPLLTQKSPYVISPVRKIESSISFGKNKTIQDQGISDEQLKQISHILEKNKEEEEENFSKLEKR